MSYFTERTQPLRHILADTPLPRLWRKLRRPLLWLLLIGYFTFAALFLTLRHVVLPQMADYRGNIEQAISSAIQLPVSIGHVEADWQGLRPKLLLNGLQVSDQQNRPALAFDRVEAVLGWRSLLYFGIRLHKLEIDSPLLNMRREADGRIFIAGLPLNMEGEDSGMADWILDQSQIVIRNATLHWDDALRQAPTLSLYRVNLNLRNSGSRHRFGLTAEPPPELAARLDLRGDLKGSDLAHLERWAGKLYAELDYADLAVWRTWVDYPLRLPRGSGGLRLWLDFADMQLTGLAADVALADVQVQLGRELPMLDLQGLHGRISGRRDDAGYSIEGKRLTLTSQPDAQTQQAIAIGPLDLQATYGMDENGQPERMEARFNSIDLGKLDALAAYLPLPKEYSALLAKLELKGRIDNLETRWDGKRKRYAIKGRFQDLGIAAYADLPGIRKLSGSIDGNESGGHITVDSRNAVLSLPSIFPEPDISLHKLKARLNWQRNGEKYDLNIEEMFFANQDAEGNVQGRYHGQMGTAGDIDLTAQLTRASGTSVWRYLPLAVNQEARDWVKQGITRGHSNDVKLVLKGDLEKFPFADGGGVFKVLVKAQGASVRPTASWPEIHSIDGDIAFVGVGMHIKAHKGQILGAGLSDVTADIADLDSLTDQTLTVIGKASGPTQEFLKFIDASPVAARINNFTTPMTASGNGELDLKLKLTLHDLDQSTVEGSYRFDNNRLQVDALLPPLTEVNGRLDFTSDGITVHDARANMLGAPLTLKVATDKNGQIDINADGKFSVPALRKLYPLPVFEHLSGSGNWKGQFTIRQSDVDVRISSDLIGLSSSLPEPFNKSAASPLELRFERKTLPVTAAANNARAQRTGARGAAPAPREMQELVLGKLARAQFIRTTGRTQAQRGYVAIGKSVEQARMPERGTLLSAAFTHLDIDFWRRMLSTEDAAKGSKTEGSGMSNPFTNVDVRAGEVVALNRTLQDVRLTAQLNNDLWKADFRSKGVNAALEWTPASGNDPGRISGRISQLTIPDPNTHILEVARASDRSMQQLPALALVVDNVNLRGQNWGSVTLDADNRNGYWNTRFAVNNEDASLSGESRWKPDPVKHDTELSFQLKAKSMEKLLARAGYADAIRRGTATLEGKLDWNDTPFNIDYPSLNGKLKLDMQNGQFKKLEPGLGRLLGVLSLQSLPRRISLDFRDVFSEGFAFDSIRGDINVSQGIMTTKDLALIGPAAKVRMSGDVNLAEETQNLNVRVQPVLGDTLAVGAMLANPAIGAVAWLAHKVLKDPIDQAFAFEYKVSGKWDDPQVTKLNTGRDINKEIAEEISKKGVTNSKDASKEADKK